MLLAAAAPAYAADPTLDIVATAQSLPQLSSLVTALTTASLVTTLQGPGPFTVFAPVDTAFSKLPTGLLTNVAKLTATLTLHVVPGRYNSSELVALAASATPYVTTVNGDLLNLTVSGPTLYLNGYAAVTIADTNCTNGWVHLVDTVIEANVVSLVDVAVSAGLSTLVSVVTSAGLAPTFSSVSVKGAFTLLAPTNAAFTALSTANANLFSWVTASKNVASLVTVLQYHAAAGAVFSRSLTNGQVIKMLNAPQNLTVGIAGSVVTFTDNQPTPTVATVTSADNAAYNGVAHVIDKVLLPTGLPYPASDIVTTAQGTATLSSLVTSLTTASLVTALQAPAGPFTVFAPVNTAFSKLPTGLLTNVAKLTATLKLHVVPGRLYAADVIAVANSATPFLTTLNGDLLNVTVVSGTVYLNGYAAITTTDVDTSNGVGESPPCCGALVVRARARAAIRGTQPLPALSDPSAPRPRRRASQCTSSTRSWRRTWSRSWTWPCPPASARWSASSRPRASRRPSRA